MESTSKSLEICTTRMSDWYLSRFFHNEHKTIPLPLKGKVTIGRELGSTVRFNSTMYRHISRIHCVLEVIDGVPTVTDCSSMSGTYINEICLGKYMPGRQTLKEGDIVNFGYNNQEIQQYYKLNQSLLMYRVCRRPNGDEAITISDEDDDVDDKTVGVPSSEGSSSKMDEIAKLSIKKEMPSSNDDGKDSSSQQPLQPRIELPVCVTIPEINITRSSFEQDYDMYVQQNQQVVKHELDTKHRVATDAQDITVVLSSDDEYNDQQYSQILSKEMKLEFDDAQEAYESDDDCILIEEADFSLASKINSDAEATSRYKPRTKDTDKFPKNTSSTNSVPTQLSDIASKKYLVENNLQLQLSKTKQSSTKPIETISHPKQSPIKILLKRRNSMSNWDVIPDKNAKKLRFDDEAPDKQSYEIQKCSMISMRRKSLADIGALEQITLEDAKKLCKNRNYQLSANVEKVSGNTGFLSDNSIRRNVEVDTNASDAGEILRRGLEVKMSNQPLKRITQRRNSVAGWDVLGAMRPGGTIEIVPPENKLQKDDPKDRFYGSDSNTSAYSTRFLGHMEVLPKGSKSTHSRPETLAEADAIYKKKLNRRYSVSDRNPIESQFKSNKKKEHKEERNSRLKEISGKKKQIDLLSKESLPTSVKKSSITKPKVKFTPNNRGMFLTNPVPPPSSKAPSTSRPTIVEESIVCTQSTMLDIVPNEEIEEVIDMRPKKMTFKNVALVSNVDRPLPGPSADCKLPVRISAAKQLEAQSAKCTSKLPLPPSSVQLPSNKEATLNASARDDRSKGLKVYSRSVITPPVPSSHCTASLQKSILKKSDNQQYRRGSGTKRVTILEDRNEIFWIEPTLENDVPEKICLKKCQAEVQKQELEILDEILKWHPPPINEPLTQFNPLNNGPFPAGYKMLPCVESYDTFETFKKIFMPFILREIWNDIVIHSRSFLQSLKLVDVSCQYTGQFDIAQIVCKVYVSKHVQTSHPKPDCGILKYRSSLNKTCSLFVYIKQPYFCTPEMTNVDDILVPHGAQLMNVILYAASRELPGLRSGSDFIFHPVTAINFYLRQCNALCILKYSHLLTNILSPAYNIQQTSAILSVLQSKPIMDHLEHSLNKDQRNVLSLVLGEIGYKDKPSISLIQGPPGTGKSRVISYLVLELMRLVPVNKNRMKILVCASSNTAIDVIVKNLLKLQKNYTNYDRCKVIRTGTKCKIDPECNEVFIDRLVQNEINRVNRIVVNSDDEHLKNMYQKERKVLDSRIRMAKEELAKGNNVSEYKLNEMIQKRKRLGNDNNLTVEVSSAEWKKQQISIRNMLLQEADIVCTTLGSCSMLGLFCKNIEFDVCLIDEASQCTELYTLLPLQYNVSKMVLIGDVQQLPATVLDRKSVDSGFTMSLFSRIYQFYESERLTQRYSISTQYRMDPEICKWPNSYFYGDRLKNDPSTEDQRKCIPLQPYMVISLSYDQELTQAQHEIYNKDEILFVVELMKQVVKCCPEHTSFAIITPYARHKNELIPCLRNNTLTQVEVHSIDSVQGKEYDVVIISLARSNGAGFLNKPERINVAMTRARQCLVLCGNFANLRSKPVWSSLLADAEQRNVYCHLEDRNEEEFRQCMVNNIMQRLRITKPRFSSSSV